MFTPEVVVEIKIKQCPVHVEEHAVDGRPGDHGIQLQVASYKLQEVAPVVIPANAGIHAWHEVVDPGSSPG